MAHWRQLGRLWLAAVLVWLSFGTLLVAAADSAADPSILVGEIGRQNNQSLLWGPYRPNLYFGVRPRIPKSLMTGLMWGKVDTYADFQHCASPTVLSPSPSGSRKTLTDDYVNM